MANNATVLVATALGLPFVNISYGSPAHRRITFFGASNVTLHMGGGFWNLATQNMQETTIRANGSTSTVNVFPTAATGQRRHSVVLRVGEYAIYTKV